MDANPWWIYPLIFIGWAGLIHFFVSEFGWKRGLAIVTGMILIIVGVFLAGAGQP